MIAAWILTGVVLCMIIQKLLWWLDKWLDSFQGIVIIPGNKAKELEQYINTPGT